MVELIYSIDDSDYQSWQAALLDWSVRRSAMTCRITRLTATAPDAETYRCLNRFWSVVHQWQPSDAQTIVILDPDMLFVRPLNAVAGRGALVVTQLGRWVVSGNAGTHAVKLVDAATGTDLSGGSVSVNTSGATAGQYLYAPLPNPIVLQPSHSYYLMSQETLGGDQWFDQNTTLTVTSDLTVYNAEWYDGNYHAGNAGSIGYVPPNFTYGPVQPAVTGQTLGTLRNDFTGWVGFRFTPASGTPVREMDWTLDPTGNWNTYVTKTSGTVDLNQTRSGNTVNEITAVSGTPSWATPAYDAAGNTTTFPQPASPTNSYTAVYDAWNRMVKISSGGSTVATYAYDGQNRRIIKVTTAISETRHFYYTNRWRDVEERTGSPATMERQYVWGVRYVDELVCRDRTSERYYALQDAVYCVTGICSVAGAIAERYLFDSYGARTILNPSWSVITASAFSWVMGHQALLHDQESALVYNRRRSYHPGFGRFITRDPLQLLYPLAHHDLQILESNLYEYLNSNPYRSTDPMGLIGTPCHFTGKYRVIVTPKPPLSTIWKLIYLLGGSSDDTALYNVHHCDCQIRCCAPKHERRSGRMYVTQWEEVDQETISKADDVAYAQLAQLLLQAAEQIGRGEQAGGEEHPPGGEPPSPGEDFDALLESAQGEELLKKLGEELKPKVEKTLQLSAAPLKFDSKCRSQCAAMKGKDWAPLGLLGD